MILELECGFFLFKVVGKKEHEKRFSLNVGLKLEGEREREIAHRYFMLLFFSRILTNSSTYVRVCLLTID